MSTLRRVRGVVLFTILVTSGVGRPPTLGQDCFQWADRTPLGPRASHAMAYDSARGVTVLFGGWDASSLYGDTWEWDGTIWTLRSTTGPSPRSECAMVYDSARGVTVLFGGSDSNYSSMGDTWEWNGTTWTLRSTIGPSPRDMHAMAYNDARGVTVLFGGWNGASFKGDTWEWNGTTWTQRSTTGPSARRWSAMAFDRAREVAVLFGGDDGPFEGDTWEWDGTTWTQRSTTGPSPRAGHAMAYDSARAVTVLFGGVEHSSLSYQGDVWEWDGTTWTPRNHTGPSRRAFHAMTYDSARDVTVLFGGLVDDPYPPYDGDTWEWDGTTWALRSTIGPFPRYHHAMAYDSARGVTVLFGGLVDDPYPPYDGDTWEWNGTTWTQRSTTGPSPRFGHAMAYDSCRGVTVLFGGFDSNSRGDTWEWDGTAWTLRSTTGPSPRHLHAMAHDSACGVTVLFGGLVAGEPKGDTWEWDGATWTQQSSSGPSPRVVASMAYDSIRGVTALFGGGNGGDFEGDTWEWEGTTWTLRSTTGPQRRIGQAMAYASDRGVTVLFGGTAVSFGTPNLLGTWEWDGGTWGLRTPSGPSPRYRHAMAYDSARGVTVLFGGADGYSYKGDTWELVSPCDEDGDGIEDDEDSCPGSDLRDGLMIADCDSGVSNHLADDGCTMTDQIGECEAEAAHHGEFVRCVVHLTRDWIHAGTIDQGDARAIRRCAARAEIPPPPPSKSDRPNPARVEAEPSDRTQAGP